MNARPQRREPSCSLYRVGAARTSRLSPRLAPRPAPLLDRRRARARAPSELASQKEGRDKNTSSTQQQTGVQAPAQRRASTPHTHQPPSGDAPPLRPPPMMRRTQLAAWMVLLALAAGEFWLAHRVAAAGRGARGWVDWLCRLCASPARGRARAGASGAFSRAPGDTAVHLGAPSSAPLGHRTASARRKGSARLGGSLELLPPGAGAPANADAPAAASQHFQGRGVNTKRRFCGRARQGEPCARPRGSALQPQLPTPTLNAPPPNTHTHPHTNTPKKQNPSRHHPDGVRAAAEHL